jgi:hypothetical protein
VDLTNPSALQLALIFIVPGFVSVKVWDLLVPSGRRDLSASSLEVFAYSSVNFAILLGPLLALDVLGAWALAHPVLGYLTWAASLFVAPIVWPVVLYNVLRSGVLKRIGVVHPTPKPWDYVFGLGEAYWIILHMKDGRRIGGRYDVKSFASSFPNDEQLYLEEVWDLDPQGRFLSRIGRTRGIMVSCQDLYGIEFFDGGQEQEQARENGPRRDDGEPAGLPTGGKKGLSTVEHDDQPAEPAK